MKPLGASAYLGQKRHTIAFVAFLALFFLSYLCLSILNRMASATSHSQVSLRLILFSFFIPTILAWASFREVAIVFFGPVAIIFCILTAWAAQSGSYLLFIPAQVVLCSLLFYFDQRMNAEAMVHNVEIEKAINEKNDMELEFKEEGTGISVSFEKYTSYYNLRNLATDFSTTLSLKELSQMIVSKTMELIPYGHCCLLFLADPDSGGLSLIASKSLEGDGKSKAKGGDVFDFWVLRNRQSLIVTDTQKDFRFDLQKMVDADDIRGLVTSPLVHEGKAVGTLRINSRKPGAFTTDHLRLLDAISTLASSAISNSLLYQKTEQLAIRDSLTGLYVRRYFLDRLAEEHRRSLLTNAPLTLLMCDLDHFKGCNDRYGHGVGDYVLIKSAEVLTQKGIDGIVARYGGEEFTILLPKYTAQQARVLAESIRAAVAEMNVMIRREVIPMTISIGVATIPVDTLDAEELIRIADQRLYEAKRGGRNRVCGGE